MLWMKTFGRRRLPLLAMCLPCSPFKLPPNGWGGFLSKWKGIWMAFLPAEILCLEVEPWGGHLVQGSQFAFLRWELVTSTGSHGDAGSQTQVGAGATSNGAHPLVCVPCPDHCARTCIVLASKKVKCFQSRGRGIVTFRMLFFFFNICKNHVCSCNVLINNVQWDLLKLTWMLIWFQLLGQ